MSGFTFIGKLIQGSLMGLGVLFIMGTIGHFNDWDIDLKAHANKVLETDEKEPVVVAVKDETMELNFEENEAKIQPVATAKVVNYDTMKKETITLDQIAENDLQCIAKISVWRDAMFKAGYTYEDDYLEAITQGQDKIFMKYPYTVPTKWINAEKVLFQKQYRSKGNDDAWAKSEINKCL